MVVYILELQSSFSPAVIKKLRAKSFSDQEELVLNPDMLTLFLVISFTRSAVSHDMCKASIITHFVLGYN